MRIPSIEQRLADLGFQKIQPSAPLRPYIRSFWHFQRLGSGPYREEFMHPGGGFGIIFNLGDTLRLDQTPIHESIFLDGTNTVSRMMGFEGRVDVLGVAFHPGMAYPFLGIPMHELVNHSLSLTLLDQPVLRDVYEQLAETPGLNEKISRVEQWLMQCLEKGRELSPLVVHSLGLLRARPVSSRTLADDLHISQRQLERLYALQVGISPKEYTRLLRFNQVRLALKNQPQETLAAVGLDFDFYDQAHFIREFKAVVGMTPLRYRQRSLQKNKTPEE